MLDVQTEDAPRLDRYQPCLRERIDVIMRRPRRPGEPAESRPRVANFQEGEGNTSRGDNFGHNMNLHGCDIAYRILKPDCGTLRNRCLKNGQPNPRG
jgi:hypothetical protein